MENSVPLSLWFGVALYAAIGLFGVVVFHEFAPLGQQTTEGYGIGYSTLAATAAPASPSALLSLAVGRRRTSGGFGLLSKL
jgi:hypothetical protein